MKTTYTDPFIPAGESTEASLTRLSANIGTLTSLIDDADHLGCFYLADMFTHLRLAKVAQARAFMSPAGL